MGYFKCLINAVIGKVEFWHDLAGVHPLYSPYLLVLTVAY